MVGFPIFASRRLRPTPYTRRVQALAVSGYTVYNHMLVATSFASLAADCAHLKNTVIEKNKLILHYRNYLPRHNVDLRACSELRKEKFA